MAHQSPLPLPTPQIYPYCQRIGLALPKDPYEFKTQHFTSSQFKLRFFSIDHAIKLRCK